MRERPLDGGFEKMRRLLRKCTAVALAAMMLTATVAVNVYANNDINVTIDGVTVEFPNARPALIDGRTLVPVRAVFEHLGFEVDWDIPTQTATITRGDDTIIITIGNATFYTNGIAHAFDVPAQIIGGSTMVPIRLPLESVGYFVGWADNAVIVSVEPIEGQEEEQTGRTAAVPPLGEIPAYITIGHRQISTNITMLNLNMTGLTTQELESLRYMVNVSNLSLSGEAFDLSPLSGLTNLTHVSFSRAHVTDLTPLQGLPNLTHLQLWNAQVTDTTLTQLSGFTNLIDLDLNGNPITDITPLSGLTNLTHLRLWNTQVSDITPLLGLANLRVLELRNTQITSSDIALLPRLTNLRHLDLSNIQIQINDITPLLELPNLRLLFLNRNQFSDISLLAEFTDLTFLDLSYNQITDITPLARLTNLNEVWITGTGNQITDWSPVDHVNRVNGRPSNWQRR